MVTIDDIHENITAFVNGRHVFVRGSPPTLGMRFVVVQKYLIPAYVES